MSQTLVYFLYIYAKIYRCLTRTKPSTYLFSIYIYVFKITAVFIDKLERKSKIHTIYVSPCGVSSFSCGLGHSHLHDMSIQYADHLRHSSERILEHIDPF